MIKRKYLLSLIVGLVVLILIVALAIYKRPLRETEEVKVAKAAIQTAKEAGAEEYAPYRLKVAQEHLLKAQKTRKREEAKSLALQAKKDAEIAEFLAKRAQRLKKETE